jgi:SNF2 family DNA or RNA helicase
LVDLRFLDAGLFGAAADFRERYELPINRDRDAQTQARLSRRIRPFVLRRLKAQVAPGLPDKIEQVAYCSLTEPQMAICQQVLQASRREILETLGTQSLAKSRLVIPNALLRLRQICCDLRLLKLEQGDPSTASAKLDLFGVLLDEALEGPPHSRGQP